MEHSKAACRELPAWARLNDGDYQKKQKHLEEQQIREAKRLKDERVYLSRLNVNAACCSLHLRCYGYLMFETLIET